MPAIKAANPQIKGCPRAWTWPHVLESRPASVHTAGIRRCAISELARTKPHDQKALSLCPVQVYQPRPHHSNRARQAALLPRHRQGVKCSWKVGPEPRERHDTDCSLLPHRLPRARFSPQWGWDSEVVTCEAGVQTGGCPSWTVIRAPRPSTGYQTLTHGSVLRMGSGCEPHRRCRPQAAVTRATRTTRRGLRQPPSKPCRTDSPLTHTGDAHTQDHRAGPSPLASPLPAGEAWCPMRLFHSH